ncbi:MAG: polyprenyl synthetase family protein [Lentisphaeria bacterium]|nr:polyprenyl synthetase family protein [Lentisphaeria bacterium]
MNEITTATDNYLATHPLKNVDLAYLEKGITHLTDAGGKRIRPALLILFGLNLGAKLESLLPIAAASEIFHTWTLVHDDIIDNDDLRRGKETTHRMLRKFVKADTTTKVDNFGTSMAILSGDLQQAWVNQLVLEAKACIPTDKLFSILEYIASTLTPKLICGEALDVELEYREPKSSDEIKMMMENKTSVLLGFCTQTGVLLALPEATYQNKLVQKAKEFAESIGLAFQLQDDILGLFGKQDTLGKPIGSDLIQGKHTLLKYYTDELATASQLQQLNQLSQANSITDEDLKKVQEIVRNCGALKAVEEKANEAINRSLSILESFPDNKYRTILRELTYYITAREK